MCTRQSRKEMRDMINTLFLTTVAVKPTFITFLQHLQTHFHGLSCQFFQVSLKKRELKITHNAFHDCCVHFSQQPFLKQLYTVASGGYLPRHFMALVNYHHQPPSLRRIIVIYTNVCAFCGMKKRCCKIPVLLKANLLLEQFNGECLREKP